MTILLGRARERVCRGCGCTDSAACVGGCSWTLMDIETPTGVCSQCAEALDWNWRAFITLGDEEDAA